MVATFARAVVDGIDIRATKEEAPRELVLSHEVHSGYPVYVDGELRAALVYCQPGWRSYTHKGWALKNLANEYAAKSYWPKARACKELLEKVPALIAEERLPDAGAVAEAQRLDAERPAREEAERQRREVWAQRARERDAEFAAGMRSIRARSDLTNLERVAIERAFERLHLSDEDDDA